MLGVLCTTRPQHHRFREDVWAVVPASRLSFVWPIPARSILTFDICILPFDLRPPRPRCGSMSDSGRFRALDFDGRRGRMTGRLHTAENTSSRLPVRREPE